MKEVLLSGDRPTGRLHLGHYVGSLKNRVKMQESGMYDMYIMIADMQALTDNFDNPKKIQDNILELYIDYLSIGIDPKKSCIFLQSQVPELNELTAYYINLVTLNRLKRNPTIKTEIKERGFEESVPMGFLLYPVSQASDITGVNGTVVPVGEDQLPILEQANEIVRSFNRIYGETLKEIKPVIPSSKNARRLVGIDGKAKMSKSLGNCIYLSETKEELERKVMSMYTDPNHINVSDPGKVEGNVVFEYLDVFVKDDSFEKYLNEFKDLDDLKQKYTLGGVGDVKIKKFLFKVLDEELMPIREKRAELEKDKDKLKKELLESSKKAREVVKENVKRVRKAIGIE